MRELLIENEGAELQIKEHYRSLCQAKEEEEERRGEERREESDVSSVTRDMQETRKRGIFHASSKGMMPSPSISMSVFLSVNSCSTFFVLLVCSTLDILSLFVCFQAK